MTAFADNNLEQEVEQPAQIVLPENRICDEDIRFTQEDRLGEDLFKFPNQGD